MPNDTISAVRYVLAFALTAVLSGCGTTSGSAPASPSTVASIPAVSAAASVASTSPSPSTSPSAATVLQLCAKETTSCPIESGTYSTAPLSPAFRLTLTAAGQNDRAWPHGGEIQLASGVFLQWGTGFLRNIRPDGATRMVGTTGDSVVLYFRSIKGFTISDPSPVTIGGKSGQSIDVTTNKTTIRGVLSIPEDNYNLAAGEKARLFLFDIDKAVVMIMVEVPKAADFDAMLTTVQPILDSIVWD